MLIIYTSYLKMVNLKFDSLTPFYYFCIDDTFKDTALLQMQKKCIVCSRSGLDMWMMYNDEDISISISSGWLCAVCPSVWCLNLGYGVNEVNVDNQTTGISNYLIMLCP